MRRTNKQDEPISRGRCLGGPLDSEKAHSRHDGADEVYVEYGKYIHDVKYNSKGQKASPGKCGHDRKVVIRVQRARPIEEAERCSRRVQNVAVRSRRVHFATSGVVRQK